MRQSSELRLRRPRRSGRLPEREQLASTLRCLKQRTALSGSATPFMSKAESLPVGRTLRQRPTRLVASGVL